MKALIALLSLLVASTTFAADRSFEGAQLSGQSIIHSPSYYTSTEGKFVIQLLEQTPSDARVFLKTGLGGTCRGFEKYSWQYIEEVELSRDCQGAHCGPWVGEFSKTLHYRSMPCQFDVLQFVFRVESQDGTYTIKGGDSALGYLQAPVPRSKFAEALPISAIDKN